MEVISARDFGRLEAKVDALLEDMAEVKANTDKDHDDYESRLRSLERWRYGIPGGFVAALIALFIQ